MEESYITKLHRVAGDCRHASDTCFIVASKLAFCLGSSAAVNELIAIGNSMNEAAEVIVDTVGNKVTEDLHNAQQQSATLLEMALAKLKE